MDLDLGGYLRPSWRFSCTLEISIQSSQVLSRHVPKDIHAAHPPVKISRFRSTGTYCVCQFWDDGRSIGPVSHHQNTLFYFLELGSIFQSLRKSWSMPLTVPCVSLDQLLYQLSNASIGNREGTTTTNSPC